jgi:hypothetical protein
VSQGPKIVLDESDFLDPPAGEVPGPPGGTDDTHAYGQATHPIDPSHPAQVTTGSPPGPALPPVATRAPLQLDGGAFTTSGRYPASGTGMRASGGRNWLVDPRTDLLCAAAVGVILAWAVTQSFGIADILSQSRAGSNAVVGLWTGVVGVMLGGTILAFDRAVAGAWEAAGRRFAQALLPMLTVAFAAGYLGNEIYLRGLQIIFEQAVHSSAIVTQNNIGFYLARGLGWAIFGLGIGATIGVIDKSRSRAVNGALGGALGGAAGGVLFQFVGANLHASVSISRLLGLLGIGALIALATRVVETARREAWLEIVGGGMAGKEFILYHSLTRLGSAPECEIFLVKDPALAKVHAYIEDRGTQRILRAAPEALVFVNQSAVSTQVLRHGDQLQLGNTVIGYSERATEHAPQQPPTANY